MKVRVEMREDQAACQHDWRYVWTNEKLGESKLIPKDLLVGRDIICIKCSLKGYTAGAK